MKKEKRFWTKEEEEYLKENYMTESYADIAKRFRRTRGAVKRKSENLGLTRRNQKPEIGDVINGWKVVEIYTKNVGKQNITYAKVESTINNKTTKYKLTQLTQGKVGWPDRRRPDVTAKNITHNLTSSRLYSIYNGIKNRCYNKNQLSYKNYGARGIIMCEEWLNNFKEFYDWAMSHEYNDELSINRKDVNKGYYPENCEWSTTYKQANNRRNNYNITAWGETKTASEWSMDKRCFVSEKNLKYRMTHGWTPEDSISIPSNRDSDNFSKYKQLYHFIKTQHPDILEDFKKIYD